ncbi:RHS repeat-associated core domain-containing protein [Rheinheimera sp. MMS21-TC3]|uniref:RHS repeat-associated core domain-containing protein n=1 Tax=Rheinheimera sp. MMS21-TC3 TaxID=3072790 RepID=UPI0028C49202|nr:RHS repeat-associated core domain-containing protein [Rheinheimera sp. MMS21-TC3]WNO61015.1 RHS repeat-associated core domain-containing protein [Rheinheimera sp. MMS21-TC3]
MGTPLSLTDSDNNIVWQAQYSVFGKAIVTVNKIDNPIRFQGQYFDNESGLHYNHFRYYDPTTGRFISQDPIGLIGGINHYQYAPNHINWVDPLGLSCKEFKTADAAALSASKLIFQRSIDEDLEYGGMIFKRQNGTYGFTQPIKGTVDGVDPGGPDSVPLGTEAVAYYHSHGAYNVLYDSENFSNAYDPDYDDWYGDIPYANDLKVDGYLVTPKGLFKKYSFIDNQVYELGKVTSD